MLWLKAWLQESAIKGPRCVDGGLLRETRLSKQQCAQEQLSSAPVAPGCEAELLSAPGLYDTSQVSTPFMSLKDNSTRKKGIPPLPQESDYFYDDYIDLNETTISEEERLLLNRKTTEKPPPAPPAQANSHYVSGDTPTIYAATKNKTSNPDTTKTATKSPSSSGFTFFGVPLPSLNTLLGGTGRKSDAEPTAQRKSAIVHVPGRGNGRGNVFPPTVPEIQSGGFVPIVPGSGGFQPMIGQSGQGGQSGQSGQGVQNLAGEEKVTPGANSSTEAGAPNVYTQTETYYNKSEPSSVDKIGNKQEYDVNNTRSETVYEIRATDTVEKFSGKPNASAPEDQILKASTMEPTRTHNSEINRTQIEMSDFMQTERFEDIFKEVVDDVSYSTTTSYEHGLLMDEFNENNASASFVSNNHDDRNYDSYSREETTEAPKKQQDNPPTPLTSLLIPGGLQPQTKQPTGRSTITKVTSPHTSASAPLSSSLKVVDVGTSASLQKEDIITEASVEEVVKADRDTSWYFTNYNSSFIEPYVGHRNLYKSDALGVKRVNMAVLWAVLQIIIHIY